MPLSKLLVSMMFAHSTGKSQCVFHSAVLKVKTLLGELPSWMEEPHITRFTLGSRAEDNIISLNAFQSSSNNQYTSFSNFTREHFFQRGWERMGRLQLRWLRGWSNARWVGGVNSALCRFSIIRVGQRHILIILKITLPQPNHSPFLMQSFQYLLFAYRWIWFMYSTSSQSVCLENTGKKSWSVTKCEDQQRLLPYSLKLQRWK